MKVFEKQTELNYATVAEKRRLERYFEAISYYVILIALVSVYFMIPGLNKALIMGIVFGGIAIMVFRYRILPPERREGKLKYSFEGKHFFFSIFDYILITFSIYVSGGVLSPFFIIYSFPILSSALILPVRYMYYGAGIHLLIMLALNFVLFGLSTSARLVSNALIITLEIALAIIIAQERVRKNQIIERDALRLEHATSDMGEKIASIQVKNRELEEVKKATMNILEDLNEAKTEAEQSAADARKFKQAVDAATDGIIITDVQGNIIYVNRRWGELTGYSFDEVRGKNPRLLQSGKTKRGTYELMWSTITRGEPFISEEIYNRRKDGSEYQQRLVVSPVQDQQGKIIYYVGLTQDITERKLIERHKTEFISVASHQLRTPLSAISWFLEMLISQEVGPLNKQQLDYMSQVASSTKRLIKLVNDLLNVSRIESKRLAINPVPTALDTLVNEVLADMRLYFEAKNCVVKFKKPKEKITPVPLDSSVIKVVIENLISNSIKYSPKKCAIDIEIVKKPESYILSVADQGMGIAKQEQEHIFDKFFRSAKATQMETEGSGLGLFISKELVEASGGRIWFESEGEDKGTTFFVELPFVGSKKIEGERGVLVTRI